MSITSALNSAMSGLRAAGRASEVVSSNISNAMTPGYARRTLSVSAASQGFSGGVHVNGIARHVDSQILSDRRLAGAEFGYRSETTRFLDRVENLLGTPGESGSLSGRLSDFENSLITASSRPDATERLEAAALSARDLVQTINEASNGVQNARTEADRMIASQVEQLNGVLKQVEQINYQITSAASKQNDTSSLKDQRQTMIDAISEIVPIRMVPRQNDTVALFSTGGAILLDGRAAEIGFQSANVVTPYMTIQDGTLSGLTVNGFAVNTSSASGNLRGGTLGAQFEIRDERAPDAQTQMDALARDLIERFESPAVDPSLTAGQPGLFTDSGATLDATIERWFTPDYIRDHDDVIAKIRSWVLANDPTVYAQCRQVLAHGVLELIRPVVPIRVPSLVMTCAYDSGSTPDMSYAIASEIEGADTIIVPTLQHMGLVEKPMLFAEPVRSFLDNQF